MNVDYNKICQVGATCILGLYDTTGKNNGYNGLNTLTEFVSKSYGQQNMLSFLIMTSYSRYIRTPMKTLSANKYMAKKFKY